MKKPRKNRVGTVESLSVFIVGKDEEKFLGECINSCSKLTREITYIDLGSKDASLEIAGKKKIRAIDYENSAPDLESLCNSDWVLFLRPNEKISSISKNIERILDPQRMGYSLIIRDNACLDMLDDYLWIKMPHRKRPDADSVYVCRVELRLVRRRYFRDLLKLMISHSEEDIFSSDSQLLKEVQIHLCKDVEKESDDSLTNRNREIKYLKGQLSCNPDNEKDISELGDNFLSFAVLSKEDLARYYKGVEMGFGSERMYLIMIHYLLSFGRFEEARDFFETWESKWGFFDTMEPYRAGGIIYANLLELNKAVSYLNKYLESESVEFLGQTLSAMAKCYLLLGEKERAISFFKQCIEHGSDDVGKGLIDLLEKREGPPSRLSVCMIVKNEEETLRRAVQSVYGIADEIIVMDTGSTDKTRDIAKEFDCRIVDASWEDDFSKARNMCLLEASGDYILFLDADEFIDSRQRIRLAITKHILPAERNTAYRVTIEQEEEDEEMMIMLRLPKTDKPDYPIRLLPALHNMRFEGTAFETPERSLRSSGIGIEWADFFKITHTSSDRKMRDARKRTAVQNAFGLIGQFDVDLRGILYFLKNGDVENALKWFRESDLGHPKLHAKIITLFIVHGIRNVEDVLRKSCNEFPDSLDLMLAAAELSYAEGRYEEVSHILAQEIVSMQEMLERTDAARARYLLAMSLLNLDDLEHGIDHMISARDLDSRNILYKIGGIYALSKGDHWEGVVGALNEIIRDEGLELKATINDLSDLGGFLLQLSYHFLDIDQLEASAILRKIVEEMTNRILNRPEMNSA